MCSARDSSTLSVTIAPEILERFPGAKVAFSLIEVVLQSGKQVKGAQASYLSNFKQQVARQLMEVGVDRSNFESIGVCRSWDRVFSMMGVDEGKKSTICSLLRRVVNEMDKLREGKKADLGKVSNFVDMYNCVSLAELTPMGAFNLAAIHGNIVLRFGRIGEMFKGLGRSATTEEVCPEHVVYADDTSVLTWLWNHRDAAHVAVPDDSEGKPSYVLLFADQAEQGIAGAGLLERPGDAEEAIARAEQEVAKIGGRVLATYCLSKTHPTAILYRTGLKNRIFG